MPVLPYLFDQPVEHATDVAFEWVEKRLIEMSVSAREKASSEQAGREASKEL